MMDYIRIQNTLPFGPKVVVLSRLLSASTEEALGVMVRWLAWLDMHTVDGQTGLTASELDEVVFNDGCRGIVRKLCKLGWAVEDADGHVAAAEFEKYCTPPAKKRISGMERQRKLRAKKGEKRA